MKGKIGNVDRSTEKYDPSAMSEGRTIMQFRDNELLFTDLGGRPKDDRQKRIIQTARLSRYGGIMTEGAQKRMTRALVLLSQAIKPKWVLNPVTGRMQYFKIAMVTLTVSGQKNIDARTGYEKLLRPFLVWLRYTKGVRHYVWKLELQERGQIHYHLAIPKFIDYREYRDKWNQIQRDAGAMRDYTARTGKLDPNSTDVHAIGNEKKVAKYMIKYLSKGQAQEKLKRLKIARRLYQAGQISEQRYQAAIDALGSQDKVNGKLWDCSESLNEKYFTVTYTDRAYSHIIRYCQSNPDAVFSGDKFMLLTVDYADPPDFLRGVMPRFRAYLDYIRAGGKRFIQSMN